MRGATMSMTCSEVARETDVPDLIPARMLNEFCYCPRLCYLEWVQGEWAHNLETLEGRFGHRRVDKPSTGDVPEPEESGSSNWWILWTILGVAAGCVLAGVVVFLVTKKGKAKPAA